MVSLFLSVCLWSVYKLLLCGCFLGRVVSLIVEQEVLIRPHPANNICVLEKCTRCGTRGWWPYTDMSCRAGSFERRPQYCNAQEQCVCLSTWALLADLHFHLSFLPFLFAFKKTYLRNTCCSLSEHYEISEWNSDVKRKKYLTSAAEFLQCLHL